MQDLSINWNFMRVHWKRVVIGILVGFAIAGVAFVSARPLWEASALIQLGQMTGPNATGPNGGPLWVESADAVVANMTRPTFIQAALQRAGRPEMVPLLLPNQYNGKGHLKVRTTSPGVLLVTVRASTKDLARQLTEGVVAELVEQHRQLGEQHLGGGEETLTKIEAELERRNKEIRLLDQQVSEARNADDNSKNANSVLIAWLISKSLADEDRNLADLISDIIVAPDARKTRMIGQVEIPDEPAFPVLPNFIALGIVLGVAAAAALLWQAKAQAAKPKAKR